MSKEREPGWTAGAWLRSVMLGQYTPRDALIDLDTEGKRQLLGDPPTAESWVAALYRGERHNRYKTRRSTASNTEL